MSKSKEKGGLGIRNLNLLNRALLGKWVLWFATEERIAWCSLISIKYRTVNGGWFTRLPKGNYGVALWKAIALEALKMKQGCVFEVGGSRKIRLWEDFWCGNSPLCEASPPFIELLTQKG